MLTTCTQPSTPQPRSQHPYQVLTTLFTLGPGPHSLKTIADHSGLGHDVIREELSAMAGAGLCTRSATKPPTYELASPTASASTWLLHALPSIETVLHLRGELRALHQETGQAVLMHSHTMLPRIRLCLDYYIGDRLDFLQQVSAHPDAAAILRQAPLTEDAPGQVIMAHLDRMSPGSLELRRIRQNGYAISAAPLPGWSLLSVPVHSTAERGLWELTGAVVAGAVTLAVPTADLGPRNLVSWLNALHRTALELTPSQEAFDTGRPLRHTA